MLSWRFVFSLLSTLDTSRALILREIGFSAIVSAFTSITDNIDTATATLLILTSLIQGAWSMQK